MHASDVHLYRQGRDRSKQMDKRHVPACPSLQAPTGAAVALALAGCAGAEDDDVHRRPPDGDGLTPSPRRDICRSSGIEPCGRRRCEFSRSSPRVTHQGAPCSAVGCGYTSQFLREKKPNRHPRTWQGGSGFTIWLTTHNLITGLKVLQRRGTKRIVHTNKLFVGSYNLFVGI
jgi:hypothetical protein